MSTPIDPSRTSTQPPSSQTIKKKPLDFCQNMFVGSVSGVAASIIMQPMTYFKNVQQSNIAQNDRSITHIKGLQKNIRLWYRGVGGITASFAPTIAIQTAASGIFSHVWSPWFATSAAGITSAIIVCPTEGIMIQQQKTGKSFRETVKYMYVGHGILGLYRALLPTAIREGVFTAAYLGATPHMKEQIQSCGVNEWVAQGIAGTVTGTIAAVISHPFDTFKTQTQENLSMKMPMMTGIFQKTAFAGLGWRVGIVVTATVVMPFVQDKINIQLDTER